MHPVGRRVVFEVVLNNGQPAHNPVQAKDGVATPQARFPGVPIAVSQERCIFNDELAYSSFMNRVKLRGLRSADTTLIGRDLNNVKPVDYPLAEEHGRYTEILTSMFDSGSGATSCTCEVAQ